MMRRPPGSTRTDTLFPSTTLCRSGVLPDLFHGALRDAARQSGVDERLQLGDPLLHRIGQRYGDIGHLCLPRSAEHTSELQSLMRISYAVFCLKNKNTSCSMSPIS